MSLKFIFIVFYILFLFTKNAYAYLDPGTFTAIINFVIALFAGIAAYVSMFWKKIKNFFTKSSKKIKK
tara:strand:+ start:1761 stop:1964 length:204 start_codon:yes stop_codon:yes gene_type:complete